MCDINECVRYSNDLLMLRNCFLDFAVEHWFGCRAIEPGFAIEIWLIDWFDDVCYHGINNLSYFVTFFPYDVNILFPIIQYERGICPFYTCKTRGCRSKILEKLLVIPDLNKAWTDIDTHIPNSYPVSFCSPDSVVADRDMYLINGIGRPPSLPFTLIPECHVLPRDNALI